MLSLLTASRALAGDVTGQVLLPGNRLAREAVIFLEGSKAPASLSKAVVDQRSKTFYPHVSVVTTGTTVEFPNNDSVLHNVFGNYDNRKFDLGVYPRGMSKRIKFDKKGVVGLLCNVHSEMSAYIVVVDTPYYAVTSPQGQFSIHGVPPGNYTLRVWHESGTMLTQAVTVKAGDMPMTLNLVRR
jgi:plastocyanin